MHIVDTQVHIWGADTPQRPWPKRQAPHRPQPITKDDLLQEMKVAGVERAVLVPPGWEGDRNDLALEAARLHPDRFVVMGRLDTDDPKVIDRLPAWTSQTGMKGVRLTFHTPWQLPLLTEGKLEWFWPLAERYGIRVMLLAPHALLHLIDAIAQRYPGLSIALDHMSIPYHTKDEASFIGLDKLLALAPRPNIAVKVSGLPCNTTEPYPYSIVQGHIRRVYDAFGPRRLFWGSDLSRLPCSYRQCVTLFTEELPWLTARDKEWIMGRALCEWLDWPLP